MLERQLEHTQDQLDVVQQQIDSHQQRLRQSFSQMPTDAQPHGGLLSTSVSPSLPSPVPPAAASRLSVSREGTSVLMLASATHTDLSSSLEKASFQSLQSFQGTDTSKDDREAETEVYPHRLLQTEEEEEAAAAMLMHDGELHNRIEPKMGGLGDVSVIVPDMASD